MAGIDERIVDMQFRSAQFLSGAAAVLMALEKLKMSLSSLKGSGKALEDIGAAGKRVDLSGISKGIETVASKFSMLGMAATAAFATIVTKATMAAGALVNKFTLAPIMAGLHEYETEMNAIQVIMANTGLKGEAGLKQIKTALDELNVYADKTIYSFEDMTSAISKFTAAGVGLDDAVAAIKGLANVAAISGAGTAQLAHAQYQLSQALASGTIRLQDWMSIEQADMGGKAFRESLMLTAKVHGINVDQMIKKDGAFRLTLQRGWLTTDIMLETLKNLTGDVGREQLKSMGYTDQQIKKVQELAKAAVDAATKIRTPTQAIATVGEMVQTTWARVWKAIFGNLTESTKLFTNVSNALTKVFVGPIASLATLLEKWNELGGRSVLIDALSDAFKGLGSIMKTIGAAFRDVFPATTASRLVEMTKSFHDFVNTLRPSASTLQTIHSIFEGLFSGLKIGLDVFKGIISVIKQMVSALLPVGTTIAGVAAKFGDFLSNLRKSIESGKGFSNAFKNIGSVLSAPLKVLGSMVQALGKLGQSIGSALIEPIKAFFSWVGHAFSSLGDTIAGSIKSGNASAIMGAINTVFLAGLILGIRNFLKVLGGLVGQASGVVKSISGIFKGLTDTLASMQDRLKAGTLEKIAIAVGILTASFLVLSFIDVKKLTKSLTAITAMMAQLIAAMALLSKVNPASIAVMFAISVAMNLMASAILILAGAVSVLSNFSWEELAKGIVGVAASMAIMLAAVNLIGKDVGRVIAASAAMILMAVALNIMAGAVAMFGNMKPETIVKGLLSIAGALVIIAGAMHLMPPTMILSAVGLVAVAVALNLMAGALKIMGTMSWSGIAKSLVLLAGALIILAAGLTAMIYALPGAAAMLVVSAALVIFAGAMKILSKFSWSEIAKSLVMLAGSLLILAVGLTAMIVALPGAAAMIVVAAALAILTPSLMALAQLTWAQLLTGLLALAGIFLVLGAAGALLGPLAGAILAVSAALLVFGLAVLAIGGGVALLGVGLTAVASAVTTSGALILAFVTNLIKLVPQMMAAVGEGMVAFAAAIAKGGPAIIAAFSAILTALLNAISRNMPLIIKVAGQMMDGFLRMVAQYGPRIITTFINLLASLLSAVAARMPLFVQKGIDIVLAFLRGIAANMGKMVKAGVDIVVAFINGITANIGRVIDAGIKLAIAAINGVANGLRNNAGAIRGAAMNLGSAIIDGITGGLWSAAGRAISAAASIASQILGALGRALKFFSPSHETWPMGVSLAEGLARGMEEGTPRAVSAAESLVQAVLGALESMDVADLQPTITPVLDLSQARRGFDDLAAMARAQQLTPSISAIYAGSISIPSPSTTEQGVVVAPGGTNISFTQNNTSPKALSEAEIYRQTKNQLSNVKGALPA